MTFLGIDIGCTSIKHGQVTLDPEILVSNFDMKFITQTSKKESITEVLLHLIQDATKYDAIGFGFPSIVWEDWILNTATVEFNQIWSEILEHLKAKKIPGFALNDADAAGLAEVYRNEAGTLRKGVTVVLTLGTGIGSAIFQDGKLLPNTEMGVIEINGVSAEKYTAPSVKTREDLSLQEWASRLQEYLCKVDILLAPDHIVLGGGISVDFEKYQDQLHTRHAKIIPAYFRNHAGVIGAAMQAARQTNYPGFSK